jgi:gluconokinase
MIVVVMGVSGAGKSTVGALLAQTLGWIFLDADDFHPQANVEKMRRGEPLTEDDRAGWLDALARRIDALVTRGDAAVLACSALRASHRARLRAAHPDAVRLVHLHGEPALIRRRLEQRRGHFMPPGLLDSQLSTLELPDDALVVDVDATPATIVERIRAGLGLAPGC